MKKQETYKMQRTKLKATWPTDKRYKIKTRNETKRLFQIELLCIKIVSWLKQKKLRVHVWNIHAIELDRIETNEGEQKISFLLVSKCTRSWLHCSLIQKPIDVKVLMCNDIHSYWVREKNIIEKNADLRADKVEFIVLIVSFFAHSAWRFCMKGNAI